MNHVCYTLDASGSMRQRVAKVCDLVKASIAKLALDDLVSLITFEENNVNIVADNVPAKDVRFNPGDYRIGGMTNLLDAVHDGNNLLQSKSKSKKKDTFVHIILTDGEENHSRRATRSSIAKELERLQATDHWTFAWLVPPECANSTANLGVDRSNILPWTDVEVASRALSVGMDNLTTARASGATSMTSGFFANLDNTLKADVRAEMTDVSAKVQRAKSKTKEPLKKFCVREFGDFTKGNAMYELVEAETVQEYKEIALIDKRRPHEIFLGGRKILGLPDGKVRLKPGNLGNYRAFVGSTSVNRNTDPGTEILYGPGIAKVGNALVK